MNDKAAIPPIFSKKNGSVLCTENYLKKTFYLLLLFIVKMIIFCHKLSMPGMSLHYVLARLCTWTFDTFLQEKDKMTTIYNHILYHSYPIIIVYHYHRQ